MDELLRVGELCVEEGKKQMKGQVYDARVLLVLLPASCMEFAGLLLPSRFPSFERLLCGLGEGRRLLGWRDADVAPNQRRLTVSIQISAHYAARGSMSE